MSDQPAAAGPEREPDGVACDGEVLGAPAAQGGGADAGEAEPVVAAKPAEGGEVAAGLGGGGAAPVGSRVAPIRLLVALLLVLLGFTFTIQARHVADDPSVTAQSQGDLVRILANLDVYEQRLREDLGELQDTHRRLSTAGRSQQEAVAEAQRRADEVGVLAGTLPVTGPGLVVRMRGAEAVTAARVLDAVQELRSAGAEAVQITGAEGESVRVVTSTYFLDADGGIVIGGRVLSAPYLMTVVGDPATLAPALRIVGGVVEAIERDGGTVTVQEAPDGVEVSAVVPRPTLQYARPGS